VLWKHEKCGGQCLLASSPLTVSKFFVTSATEVLSESLSQDTILQCLNAEPGIFRPESPECRTDPGARAILEKL